MFVFTILTNIVIMKLFHINININIIIKNNNNMNYLLKIKSRGLIHSIKTEKDSDELMSI